MITKTDFLAYLDAPRHLWALKNNKIEKNQINTFVQHLFDQGYQVEEYAEKYIIKHLIPRYNVKEYKLQPKQIDGHYQATTDILIKNTKTNKWDMYEVKSTTKVDKTHIYDAAFQVLVFEKHYDLGDIYILHLDKDYIKQGDIDLNLMFKATKVTENINMIKDQVQDKRYDAYITSKSNNYQASHWCYKPGSCPCPEICHKNLPEYSIFDINRISLSKRKIDELVESDIYDIKNVPSDFDLSELQKKQVQVAKSKNVFIDKNSIKQHMSNLQYPLYFLDYESFNSAIPLFNGFKPFDHITFQYSLHVKRGKDSNNLEHYEYLHTKPTDPIDDLLGSLKQNIGNSGSIIVWNKGFEKKQNTRMAEIKAEYKDFVHNMNHRIYDLMEIFQRLLYVDNKAKGSYSIKQILPIFDNTLNYKEMSIGDGATAMITWNKLVNHSDGENYQKSNGENYKKSDGEKEKIIKDLLKYCKLDTLAMVKVLEGLEREVG